jgi:hypothetical protein
MATGYTPILKLALPVTGELNGTWGDVVNQNITEMVEQAVAGLATINTWTANSHTLTTANGTTSESRCAMLVIDDDGAGNPSAAATVICPTATKSYIVRNLCGQTVTVKTAAGSGVAVPNNQAALVFCDGTNVVVGAFNGDVVGPATSTNNAIVTFDGTTGKIIKDNSGATISAGVITATGFSGPLNGTVGATTPATGAFTTASATTGNITTVNATTVDTTNLEVTNLKAKDGTSAGSIADATGVVTLASSVLTTTDINGGTIDATSIGATTPSTVVATQVDITAQGDLRLQDTTGGEYVALQAPGTLASSYTLTLPVDDGTAGQALITDGSGALSWSSAASGDVYGPASATDNAVARYDGTTGKIIQNSGVTIDDSNNVVGVAQLNATTVDTTNIEVTNLKAKDGTAAGSIADATGVVTLASSVLTTTDINGGTIDNVTIGGASAGAGSFTNLAYTGTLTGGTGVVNIGSGQVYKDASGNVGIGTSSPQTILQLGGATDKAMRVDTALSNAAFYSGWQNTAQIGVNRNPATGLFVDAAKAASAIRLSASNADSFITLETTAANNTAPSERMRIDASGNLGLGVTPSAWGTNYKAIESAGNSAFVLSSANVNPVILAGNVYSTNSNWIYKTTGAAANFEVGYTGGFAWNIAPSGTAGNAATFTRAMTLTSTGNLGIGITPSIKFEVEGGSASNVAAIRSTVETGSALLYTVNSNASAAQWYVGHNGIDVDTGNLRAGALKFVTNSSEKMRIDSSGNVGIGVTPSAWAVAKALQINARASLFAFSNDSHVGYNAYYSDTYRYIASDFASRYTQTAGQHQWHTAPSGTAGNAISFTQTMTLTPSVLSVNGVIATENQGTASSQIRAVNTGGTFYHGIDTSTGSSFGTAYAAVLWHSGAYPLVFATGDSERMRISSTGELSIGKTVTTATGAGVVIDDTGLIRITRDGTGSATVMQFNNNGGTAVGTISTSGSATAYNTSSDYRLKENVAPMQSALATVAALKPVTYTWKNDGSAGQGFIAHELQSVVPDCVTGEKDAVDSEGKPQYQGVDTSFLVATLVAAIQELKAEIDLLKGN